MFGATFLKEIGAFGGYLLLAIGIILITMAVAFGTTLPGSAGGGAGGPAVPVAVVAIAGAATSNSTLVFAGQGLYMLFALFTGFGFELFYAAAKVQTDRR